MKLSYLLSAALLLFLVSACASLDRHYIASVETWEETAPALPDTVPVIHTVYLLGDAGGSKLGKIDPAIKFFGKFLDTASVHSTAVYLGDNIYDKGLPPRNDPGREKAEHKINVQMDVAKDYAGKIIFIPGNHDWYSGGVRSARREEAYVEAYLDRGNTFLPDDGCGGPHVYESPDGVVVVAIDSEWYIANWSVNPTINAGCDVRSRDEFIAEFEATLRRYNDREVLIVLHHPLYSNGHHGGVYTWKQHLFPLLAANKKLWIPMPGFGSLVSFLRAGTGTRADIAYPRYSELRDRLMDVAERNGNYIFASGHEHTLQHWEVRDQTLIVSGSGSKSNPVRAGRGALFAYGGVGHAVLKYYADGSVWVEYWGADDEGETGEIIFRHQVKGPREEVAMEQLAEARPFEPLADSVTVRIKEPKNNKESVVTGRGKLFGGYYRSAYGQEVTLPVLDLEDYRGGLAPVKRGGGLQTANLRLVDSLGRQSVLRSVLKMKQDNGLFLYGDNRTVNLFRNQFASSHPLGAVIIPPLAESVNVYHTEPRAFYLPRQPALGRFNPEFADRVYLLEIRPDEEWADTDYFGGSEDVISTAKLKGRMFKNVRHRPDQHWTVRSRLFDMLLGDWDREEDNWRWAAFPNDTNNIKVYRPIPRDRDQAFSKYNGAVPNLLYAALPFVRQVTGFNQPSKGAETFNFAARHFDQFFLNQLTWADWEAQIAFIQSQLTDELIERAVYERLPGPMAAEDGEDLIKNLRERRDKLPEFARNYYELLMRQVTIIGSEDRERFEVTRLPGGGTQVDMWELSKKKGKKKALVYSRLFDADITDEIVLYGLSGDDVFEVSGESSEGIKLRLVGGEDADEFYERSTVLGNTRNTLIYDSPTGNVLELGQEGRDKTSDRIQLNTYDDRTRYNNYDFTSLGLQGGYDPDRGVNAGFALKRYVHEFQKPTFGQVHEFYGFYANETDGFRLGYFGQFRDAYKANDIIFGARYQSPQYTRNFFGLGNETDFAVDGRDPGDPDAGPGDNFDFYRVQLPRADFVTGIRKRFLINNYLDLVLRTRAIRAERADDNFLATVVDEDSPMAVDLYNFQWFTGPEINTYFQNVDDPTTTAVGIKVGLKFGWQFSLRELRNNYTYQHLYLNFYQALTPGNALSIATRVGLHTNQGNFDFYNAPTLGGLTNFRGAPGERFAGKTVLYNNNDLRIRAFNARNFYIPLKGGLVGSFDLGRVWHPESVSSRWHNSYGGGLWFSPFGTSVVSLTAHSFEERWRYVLRGGFFF